MTAVLDWSGRHGAPLAFVGELAPCQRGRRPALLRHPRSGKPCHKVCEQRARAVLISTAGGARR